MTSERGDKQPVPKAIGALSAIANGMDRLALDAAPYEAEHLHSWARNLRAIAKDLGDA